MDTPNIDPILDAQARWRVPLAPSSPCSTASVACADPGGATPWVQISSAVRRDAIGPALYIDMRPLAYPLLSGLPEWVDIPETALLARLRPYYARQVCLRVILANQQTLYLGGPQSPRPCALAEALLGWATRARPEWRKALLDGRLPQWGYGTEYRSPVEWYVAHRDALRNADDGPWAQLASRHVARHQDALCGLATKALDSDVPGSVSACPFYPDAYTVDVTLDATHRFYMVVGKKGDRIHDYVYATQRQSPEPTTGVWVPHVIRSERYPAVSRVFETDGDSADCADRRQIFEVILARGAAGCENQASANSNIGSPAPGMATSVRL